VGFEKFNVFFSSYYFWTIISNTLRISFVALIFNTLVPIIFALLVNEVQNKKFKSFIQTITYTPHFISLVVLVGMINTLFAFDGGAINNILTFFNLKPIDFLGTPKYFVWLFTFSGLWQSMGWWAIIYIGTLSNIDPSLHEAAVIDGAGRLRRMISINIPHILPVAIVLFIMAMGSMMNVGFEKVYLMQNSSNREVSEVMATYIYRVSFITANDYSLGTAIGLFNSVINIVLLISANFISKKITNESLW